MILTNKEQAIHKAQMFRLLIGICDEPEFLQNVYFKGGTCAMMLGYIDRFSVDLDFDLNAASDKALFRKKLHAIFRKLGL